MISRYADIEPAMSDWRTFSSARGVLVGTHSSQLPLNMFNMDPPRHDQLRSVLSRMLRENPDLWPDAMEELIRYESPVQGLARTAMRDVELHGVTIPEGEWVLMLFGSANHDETVYDDPDRLDITRKG